MRARGEGEETGGWAVVVPSCRPGRLEEFLNAWGTLFDRHGVELFVVRDEPPWEGIPEFIPRRSDMIRSWGFYKAWVSGAGYVLSLDDDVIPDADVFAEYERCFNRGWPCVPYLSVGSLTTSGVEMRGFPYDDRYADAVVQYGGWKGTLDYDAATQLTRPERCERFYVGVVPVPKGCATTTCAMNFAFKAAYTPVMWQLPILEERFNRFGDIWSGLFQKKVLDAMGKVMLVNGRALVWHKRASNPFGNLRKESLGLEWNEDIWETLADPTVTSMMDAYFQVTESAARLFRDPYRSYFKKCRDEWLSLFS